MKLAYYNDLIVDLCDNNHLSVDDIFERIAEKYPSVGRSSVYRNVELLVKEGKLNKLTGVGNKSYFEKAKQNHIHFVDEQTGQIIDVDIDALSLNLPQGFQVSNVDCKVYGSMSV
ncbi:transcriptional repressor [Candidatus Gracilibacteria bacterium]|nr:transcriptional repressor [Candidatus Gracilibacteria bacterium]